MVGLPLKTLKGPANDEESEERTVVTRGVGPDTADERC